MVKLGRESIGVPKGSVDEVVPFPSYRTFGS
jgi:hypothetical protein